MTPFWLGPWLVEPALNRLSCDDTVSHVEPKVMEVLVCLASKPGELVSKAELIRFVWSDTSVSEHVLTYSISQLRKVFGDDAHEPRFIETVSRKGYRLVATVESDAPKTLASEPRPGGKVESSRGVLIGAGVAILFSALLGATFWSGNDTARLVSTVQLTNNRVNKAGPLVTDGTRIYFSEEREGKLVPVEVSITGGEPTVIQSSLGEAWVQDISLDGSQLLVIKPFPEEELARGSLWSLSLPAALPHRVGELVAVAAAWSHDGRWIAHADDNNLYVSTRAGTQTRKLWTAPGYIRRIRFSADDSRLRFDVFNRTVGRNLYEIGADGSSPHLLVSNWIDGHQECCGNWTRDGSFYLFKSLRGAIWALHEPSRLLSRWQVPRRPIQLTAGAVEMEYPVPSLDGKNVFVLGRQSEPELLRLDAGSGEFRSYLTGISPISLAFSRDGQWIAYTDSLGNLWRSRLDGSAKLQITAPPVIAFDLAWSPDGKQIAYSAFGEPGPLLEAYVVAAEGGTPRRLTRDGRGEVRPTWSGDGNFIVFGNYTFPGAPSTGIHRVDLRSFSESIIEGSQGFTDPASSPDGHWIAAVAYSPRRLMLWDTRTQKWSELAALGHSYNLGVWSADSSFFYYDVNNEIFRIKLSSRSIERVARLQSIPRDPTLPWFGLAPNGSLLIIQDNSIRQVYSLHWKIE